MGFILSFVSGQILFNTSAMILLVSLNALLLNKCHYKNNTEKEIKKSIIKEAKEKKKLSKIN